MTSDVRDALGGGGSSRSARRPARAERVTSALGRLHFGSEGPNGRVPLV